VEGEQAMMIALDQLSEEQALHLLRAGERKGMEWIFYQYYDTLVRFATPILKSEDAARDTVQEVFLNIWRLREQLQVDLNLKAYLFTSVRNKSFNVLKKHEKEAWLSDDAEVLDRIAGNRNATQDLITDRLLQRSLDQALNKIPPKCRQVFHLSRFEGFSYKQIASCLEISEKTVENQMGKALQILRKELLPLLSCWFIISSF
jgi:RNA polymerase sigma-70 factor, ECF subfamily